MPLAVHEDLKEAEEMYLRALEGKKKALGRDHTSTLDTAHNLGSLYRKQGKLEIRENVAVSTATQINRPIWTNTDEATIKENVAVHTGDQIGSRFWHGGSFGMVTSGTHPGTTTGFGTSSGRKLPHPGRSGY